MSEPATVSPPSIRANASLVPVPTNLVAAFLAGSLFLPLTVHVGGYEYYGYGYRYSHPHYAEISVDVADLERAIVLLVALAVSLTAVRQLGWILSAVGMAVEVYLLFQGNGLPRDAFFPILAVAVGLQLGGMLAAFATSDTASRWACAVGLGAGVVAGWKVYNNILFAERPDILSRDGLLMGAIAGLVLVAGAALLVPGVRVAVPSSGRANWWGPVVAIVAATVVGRVLWRVWQPALDDMARSTEGGTDPRNAMIETLDQGVGIGIAVVILVILLVAAYQRGGASLARWVVIGLALGATGMALPTDFDGNVVVDVLVPAAAGAVAAAAVVRWADRWVPADAVGVALAAVAVLLSSPGSVGLPASEGAMIALAFAYAFTLTAGLARLTDASGRGIAGAEVAGSAALGFAVLLLAEPVFTPPGFLQAYLYQPVQVSRVLTLAGAAVVLLLLFRLSASVRRVRREIASDTAGGGTPGVPTQAGPPATSQGNE